MYLQSYVTNQGLKRHTMEHTGDYPFKCEQCPKVCTILILRIYYATHFLIPFYALLFYRSLLAYQNLKNTH